MSTGWPLAGNKKQVFWVTLGTLILFVPVFWSMKAQGPFLYAKELFVKYGMLVLLAAALWRYNKFLSIFVFFCFADSFSRLSERNLWALGDLRDFLTYYLILRIFITNLAGINLLLKIWLLALATPFVVSWLQYFGHDPISRSGFLFSGTHWPIAGFFGNTHVLVNWLAVNLPLLFLLPSYFAWSGAILIIGSLIAFKGIGSGFAASLIALTAYLVFKIKNKFRYALLILLVLAMISVFAFDWSGVMIRKEILTATMPSILEHPIRGWGLNSFSSLGIQIRNTFEAQAHNEYLQTYVELGLFACIILLVFIYSYLKAIIKIIKSREGCITASIFIAYLFYAAYGFPMHMAHSALFFLTILACFDTLIETN